MDSRGFRSGKPPWIRIVSAMGSRHGFAWFPQWEAAMESYSFRSGKPPWIRVVSAVGKPPWIRIVSAVAKPPWIGIVSAVGSRHGFAWSACRGKPPRNRMLSAVWTAPHPRAPHTLCSGCLPSPGRHSGSRRAAGDKAAGCAASQGRGGSHRVCSVGDKRTSEVSEDKKGG